MHRITRILSIRNFRINPNNVNKIHFHEASTIISPLINSKVLSLPSLFDSSKSSPSPLQNSARDRGIDRRIKTRFCTRLVFFLNETSHRGQRGRERDGERFSPTAVSHPSLLQIVYPSRGGPSTRRILYYRLEYLTRQETPRHRGIGKEVSPRPPSFSTYLFHPPPASWGVQPPPLILFSSIGGRNFRSLSPFFSSLFPSLLVGREISCDTVSYLSTLLSPALHHGSRVWTLLNDRRVLVNRRYRWIIHPRGVPF